VLFSIWFVVKGAENMFAHNANISVPAFRLYFIIEETSLNCIVVFSFEETVRFMGG